MCVWVCVHPPSSPTTVRAACLGPWALLVLPTQSSVTAFSRRLHRPAPGRIVPMIVPFGGPARDCARAPIASHPTPRDACGELQSPELSDDLSFSTSPARAANTAVLLPPSPLSRARRATPATVAGSKVLATLCVLCGGSGSCRTTTRLSTGDCIKVHMGVALPRGCGHYLRRFPCPRPYPQISLHTESLSHRRCNLEGYCAEQLGEALMGQVMQVREGGWGQARVGVPIGGGGGMYEEQRPLKRCK